VQGTTPPEDTTAPDVEITGAVDRTGKQVSDGGRTPIPYIRITFEATDAVGIDSIECSLDGEAFTSCTSPVVYDRLSRGSHEVTVRATDAAGNTGEDEFSWTVGAPPAQAGARGQPAATEEDTAATTDEEGAEGGEPEPEPGDGSEGGEDEPT